MVCRDGSNSGIPGLKRARRGSAGNFPSKLKGLAVASSLSAPSPPVCFTPRLLFRFRRCGVVEVLFERLNAAEVLDSAIDSMQRELSAIRGLYLIITKSAKNFYS